MPSKTEARRELKPPRIGAVRWSTIPEGRGEGRNVGHRDRYRHVGRGNRWPKVNFSAVVLVEVRMVEEIETLAQQLQYVLFLDMKFSRQPHIQSVVGPS